MNKARLKPALFLHIQKTGGTSIQQMARKAYGMEQVISHDDYLRLGVRGCREKAFVSGHFGFEFAKRLMDGRFSFTFLRDPVARVASFYQYCRKDQTPNFEPSVVAKKYGLGDFLRFCMDNVWYSSYISNHQLEQLAYGYGHELVLGRAFSPAERQPGPFLPVAKRNLEKFDFIGFIDTFDTDARLIFRCLGVPKIKIIKANVSAGRGLPEIDPATREFIQDITKFDAEIIAYARTVAVGKRQAAEQMLAERGGWKHAAILHAGRRILNAATGSRRISRRFQPSAEAVTDGHVFISGTGQSASTVLMQLLTQLGLDTGYARRDRSDVQTGKPVADLDKLVIEAAPSPRLFFAADAGLDKDPFVFENPAIVKSPVLCDKLDAVLDAGIGIRNIIIPVEKEDLEPAVAPHGQGDAARDIQGGVVSAGHHSLDEQLGQQNTPCARFLRLIESAVRNEIPMTFLAFPRFLTDPDYLFDKISPIFPELQRGAFLAAHAKVAQPEFGHIAGNAGQT